LSTFIRERFIQCEEQFKLSLLLLVVILGLGVYQYKTSQNNIPQNDSRSDSMPSQIANQEPLIIENSTVEDTADTVSSQFSCDGRQHCSQMTSREEAEFFIRNCPDTKMDGDHDGIPCENDKRW